MIFNNLKIINGLLIFIKFTKIETELLFLFV